MQSSTLVVVATIFLVYALLSRRLHGTSITAPIVFVIGGFVTSAEVLGWVHIELGHEGVSVLAEATLAVVLFTDASRIDLGALRHEYAVPARLLGIGLPLTIVAGAVAGAVVLPNITLLEALVLAIVLAPTDAALGQAVVTDTELPSRVRQGLNVESGLNDGLCVPLLAIALAIAEANSGAMTGGRALHLIIEAIGWGVFGGVVAGGVVGYALRFARARRWIDGHWIQIILAIAAGAAYGLADARGGSGFIAAFVGGVIYGRLADPDGHEAAFSEELGAVLNGATLIVFGAAVLASLWSEIGVAALVYAVLSLTAVRMLPVAVAMLGSRARPQTVLFLGWFGPRGLASIVFAIVVVDASGLDHTPTLMAAATATVALSVVAHGVTAAPLARVYAQWRAKEQPQMESEPAPEQRWRHDSPLAPSPAAR